MSKKNPVPRKKRRTREHVIADLSANHVERHALLCGFSVERRIHDYGIDLALLTYDPDGGVENGEIFIQLKATDHLKVAASQSFVVCRVERADALAWVGEPMPVILVVYDAAANVAYWLYIQQYFQQVRWRSESASTLTVRIPLTNVIDAGAMRHFANFRDRLLAQMKGLLHSHE